MTMPRVVTTCPSSGETCPAPWIWLIGVKLMSSSMMVPDLLIGSAWLRSAPLKLDRVMVIVALPSVTVLGTVSTLIRYGVAALSSSVTLAGPV